MDLLAPYKKSIAWDQIVQARQSCSLGHVSPRVQNILHHVGRFHSPKTEYIQLKDSEVSIGHPEELNSEQHLLLENALQSFIPWKKGPFKIFGHSIDSEWQSNLKWDRIQRFMPDLRGKIIADIGCNNGYYLFRMASHKPKLALGIEPVAKHKICFDFLANMTSIRSLQFEPLGVEHIDYFPKFFDVVFCLGILYHQLDPVRNAS